MNPLRSDGSPRVVITGMGAVTPLGGVYDLWPALLAGRSGIRLLQNIPSQHLPVRIGGEVAAFTLPDNIPPREVRRMGRASLLALAASHSAVQDAGLTPQLLEAEGERVAVVIGTTLGAHELAAETAYRYRESGYKKPNPLGLINALPNIPAHHVSLYMRTFGVLSAPSSACASGTQAIGEAADLIRYRRADLVIAGGVEAVIQDYIIAGFDAMRALARGYEQFPQQASRPFDANRSGFVIAEGCGVVILESMEHALQRGARPFAEVLGHASSSDAYHIAIIDPSGNGPYRSMQWALQDAQLDAGAVGYINAHGTSTHDNDLVETLAIKRLFGSRAGSIPVSSTKSMIGHPLAASGAIGVIVCALALRDQVLHPTINYTTPDPECDLDYVPNTARRVRGLRYTMNNSFGLGGQNASIVIGVME